MDYAWAFPYCSSMGFDFQAYPQGPGTVLCVQASSETQSLSSKNTDCFIFSAFLFLERCVLGLPFGQWKLHIHFRVIVIWNEAVKQGDWEVRGRTRNRPGEPQQVWEQSVCVYANWELHTCTVNGRNC